MIKERLGRVKKFCSKCRKKKPLDDFCKGKSTHGRTAWCKECVAEKKRADRRDPSKREKLRAQSKRERNSESRKRWHREDILSGRSAERSRKTAKAYYERNREKILKRHRERSKEPKRRHQAKCNLLISLMVYFGMLEREPCQVCGREDKVQAAHRGYDDPLDIFWACPMHHRHYDKGWIDEHGNVLR